MKRLAMILIFSLFAAAYAIEVTELEKYRGKDYGPEYFYAIEGELSGKAAPGVETVFVNGKPVEVDVDLSFNAPIYLDKGEKHLTIETRYKGLSFTKQYLVIRHPSGKKSLKIHVPRAEFENILKHKKADFLKPASDGQKRKESKSPAKKKKMVQKPKPEPQPAQYEIVRELAPGKIFTVQFADGKYSAAIYIPENKTWIPLDKISHQELKVLLKK